MQGVYLIIHRPTGLRYVGSSNDVKLRWQGHQSDLRLGKVKSRRFQLLWNMHGFEAFEWLVLEQCSEDQLLVREQWYLDHTIRWGLDFNICRVAGRTSGWKMSDAQKKTLSEQRKGQISPRKGVKLTSETKQKLSVAHLGKTTGPRPDWVRKKISDGNKGKKKSPEHKQHIAESGTQFPKGIVPWNKSASSKNAKKKQLARERKEQGLENSTRFHKGQVAWNKGVPSTRSRDANGRFL